MWTALPLPADKGRAGTAGGAAHHSSEAAGHGNYLENNHSPVSRFCVLTGMCSCGGLWESKDNVS